MKQKICIAAFIVSLLLTIGIIGGIDCGAPLTNALWCIPLVGIMGLSVYIGEKSI